MKRLSKMERLTGIAAVFLGRYGFGAASWRGALTGTIAAIGVGSAISIWLSERALGLSSLLVGAACLGGVIYGGWTAGWLWGVGGYLAGLVAATMLAVIIKHFKFQKPKVELCGFVRKLLSDAYAHIVTMEDPAGELDTEGVFSQRVTEDYRIDPYAEVGPLGRRFMLDERQRAFGEGEPTKWNYFKEQPNRMRIAFDLFFIILSGLCAKYVLRGRLRQPVETHGSS